MAKNQAASGIAKFAGDDFAAWKFSMEMVLKKKGLWIVVNQGLDAASEAFCIKKGLKSEDPERKVVGPLHASEMNDKALAEIVLALDEGYQGLVRGISNAKEAWKALCDNYQRSTTLNKLHLKQQLMELKMRDGDDMMLHINKLVKIAEQLKEAQAEEPPESLMLYLLKSLPKEWDNFVAPMMLIIDTLDLPKVKANLLLEATRRKQTADARETKEEAMLSKQGGDEAQISRTRKSFAKSNWRRRGQRPLECYVCGEGHRAAQCPKRFHKARQTANEADEADESCHLVNEANKAKPSLEPSRSESQKAGDTSRQKRKATSSSLVQGEQSASFKLSTSLTSTRTCCRSAGSTRSRQWWRNQKRKQNWPIRRLLTTSCCGTPEWDTLAGMR